jgi:hypothetical protein
MWVEAPDFSPGERVFKPAETLLHMIEGFSPGDAKASRLYHGAIDRAAGRIGAPVRDGSQRISRR